MKLTAKIKLQPNSEPFQLLDATSKTANAACNDISQIAWDHKTFGQFQIHKLVYHDAKARFGLSAQVVVRCIAKVTDAYKLDKETQRTFDPYGAMPYDDRGLKYGVDDQRVSIWVIGGRAKLAFACGQRHRELRQTRKGAADLCYIDGDFYLFATCDIDEPTIDDVEGVMGVDLGVVNIATEDDGTKHSGTKVNTVRSRRQRQRKRLQKQGTKSAKRGLKKMKRKASRFAKDVNHVISKRIAQQAKRTGRAIALEDLKGIRDRVRLRKSQRYALHRWSFHDLTEKIKYKANLAGVAVVMIDPRNTSRKCSECGCIDKKHRKKQDTFLCVPCGFSANADHNAAINIAVLGWAGLSSGHTAHALPQTLARPMSAVG